MSSSLLREFVRSILLETVVAQASEVVATIEQIASERSIDVEIFIDTQYYVVIKTRLSDEDSAAIVTAVEKLGWSLRHNNSNSRKDRIAFEANETPTIVPPRYVFHATPREKLETILDVGLNPVKTPVPGKLYEPRTYVTTTYNHAIDVIQDLIFYHSRSSPDEFVILRCDTFAMTGDTTFFVDPNLPETALYTRGSFPPNAVVPFTQRWDMSSRTWVEEPETNGN